MPPFLICTGSAGQDLKVTESNGSSVCIQLPKGRDGLPGRDGIRGPVGPPGPQSGGAIYTRWGKSSCPQVGGTDMVYSGVTGGTYWNKPGGGANYLCMPTDPEYSLNLTYRAGESYAYVYSTGYARSYRNVPCAVCHVSTRPTVLMIPAKPSCPPTWTREYYGYLMTTHKNDPHHRTMFECVDRDQESLPGSRAGAVFYHVQAYRGTGGLQYSQYTNKELNCVVCTK